MSDDEKEAIPPNNSTREQENTEENIVNEEKSIQKIEISTKSIDGIDNFNANKKREMTLEGDDKNGQDNAITEITRESAGEIETPLDFDFKENSNENLIKTNKSRKSKRSRKKKYSAKQLIKSNDIPDKEEVKGNAVIESNSDNKSVSINEEHYKDENTVEKIQDFEKITEIKFNQHVNEDTKIIKSEVVEATCIEEANSAYTEEIKIEMVTNDTNIEIKKETKMNTKIQNKSEENGTNQNSSTPSKVEKTDTVKDKIYTEKFYNIPLENKGINDKNTQDIHLNEHGLQKKVEECVKAEKEKEKSDNDIDMSTTMEEINYETINAKEESNSGNDDSGFIVYTKRKRNKQKNKNNENLKKDKLITIQNNSGLNERNQNDRVLQRKYENCAIEVKEKDTISIPEKIYIHESNNISNKISEEVIQGTNNLQVHGLIENDDFDKKEKVKKCIQDKNIMHNLNEKNENKVNETKETKSEPIITPKLDIEIDVNKDKEINTYFEEKDDSENNNIYVTKPKQNENNYYLNRESIIKINTTQTNTVLNKKDIAPQSNDGKNTFEKDNNIGVETKKHISGDVKNISSENTDIIEKVIQDTDNSKVQKYEFDKINKIEERVPDKNYQKTSKNDENINNKIIETKEDSEVTPELSVNEYNSENKESGLKIRTKSKKNKRKNKNNIVTSAPTKIIQKDKDKNIDNCEKDISVDVNNISNEVTDKVTRDTDNSKIQVDFIKNECENNKKLEEYDMIMSTEDECVQNEKINNKLIQNDKKEETTEEVILTPNEDVNKFRVDTYKKDTHIKEESSGNKDLGFKSHTKPKKNKNKKKKQLHTQDKNEAKPIEINTGFNEKDRDPQSNDKQTIGIKSEKHISNNLHNVSFENKEIINEFTLDTYNSKVQETEKNIKYDKIGKEEECVQDEEIEQKPIENVEIKNYKTIETTEHLIINTKLNVNENEEEKNNNNSKSKEISNSEDDVLGLKVHIKSKNNKDKYDDQDYIRNYSMKNTTQTDAKLNENMEKDITISVVEKCIIYDKEKKKDSDSKEGVPGDINNISIENNDITDKNTQDTDNSTIQGVFKQECENKTNVEKCDTIKSAENVQYEKKNDKLIQNDEKKETTEELLLTSKEAVNKCEVETYKDVRNIKHESNGNKDVGFKTDTKPKKNKNKKKNKLYTKNENEVKPIQTNTSFNEKGTPQSNEKQTIGIESEKHISGNSNYISFENKEIINEINLDTDNSKIKKTVKNDEHHKINVNENEEEKKNEKTKFKEISSFENDDSGFILYTKPKKNKHKNKNINDSRNDIVNTTQTDTGFNKNIEKDRVFQNIDEKFVIDNKGKNIDIVLETDIPANLNNITSKNDTTDIQITDNSKVKSIVNNVEYDKNLVVEECIQDNKYIYKLVKIDENKSNEVLETKEDSIKTNQLDVNENRDKQNKEKLISENDDSGSHTKPNIINNDYNEVNLTQNNTGINEKNQRDENYAIYVKDRKILIVPVKEISADLYDISCDGIKLADFQGNKDIDNYKVQDLLKNAVLNEKHEVKEQIQGEKENYKLLDNKYEKLETREKKGDQTTISKFDNNIEVNEKIKDNTEKPRIEEKIKSVNDVMKQTKNTKQKENNNDKEEAGSSTKTLNNPENKKKKRKDSSYMVETDFSFELKDVQNKKRKQKNSFENTVETAAKEPSMITNHESENVSSVNEEKKPRKTLKDYMREKQEKCTITTAIVKRLTPEEVAMLSAVFPPEESTFEEPAIEEARLERSIREFETLASSNNETMPKTVAIRQPISVSEKPLNDDETGNFSVSSTRKEASSAEEAPKRSFVISDILLEDLHEKTCNLKEGETIVLFENVLPKGDILCLQGLKNSVSDADFLWANWYFTHKFVIDRKYKFLKSVLVDDGLPCVRPDFFAQRPPVYTRKTNCFDIIVEK